MLKWLGSLFINAAKGIHPDPKNTPITHQKLLDQGWVYADDAGVYFTYGNSYTLLEGTCSSSWIFGRYSKFDASVNTMEELDQAIQDLKDKGLI